MKGEIPDGVVQLRSLLKSIFQGQLENPNDKRASDKYKEADERNFLSRALAAYAVHKLAGCTIKDAVDSVVDGGGDGGIDAIFYARQTTDTLWVIQSKFVADGQGEPDSGGLSKFLEGIKSLLAGELDYFSESQAWQKHLPTLKTVMQGSEPLQVRGIIVYSSIQPITSSRMRGYHRLVESEYGEDGYFTYTSYNLTSILEWMTDADQSLGIPELEITFHHPNRLKRPYETIFGLVKLSDLVMLYRQHGKQLVAANIRAYKGDTEVNRSIVETLETEPELFVYLNNGLTAYCDRFRVVHRYKTNTKLKVAKVHGLSVINGAQTLGAIGQLSTENGQETPDGYVFIKLISLERCDEDVEFAQRITRTANSQNRIDIHHFAAQHPYQITTARRLQLSGIHYHYRDDADVPASDEHNFTLKEAATALACIEQDSRCDLIARIVANRKSLLSMERAGETASRYERVFDVTRSARMVWRAVQVQSVVVDTMKATTRSERGARKQFFIYARWLLLNIIFLKSRKHRGSAMSLTPEEVEEIVIMTSEFAEKLWSVCEREGFVSRSISGGQFDMQKGFQSIFGNSADCRTLRNGLLRLLNQR